jgi:HK97 family phage portal protein
MARGLTKLIERSFVQPGELVERAASPAPFVGAPMPRGSAYAYDTTGGTITSAPSESTTLGISAAWRCQHILSDGIGALDIFAYDERNDDARVETPKVLADPWVAITPVEWRAMVVASLVLHGNAYLIPWDIDPRTGYPRQLPVIHPSKMRVDVVGGRPRYRLENSEYELDVLHIRGLVMPGALTGLGVIEAQRKGLALALEMDQYQSGNFRESSVPPVIIKVNRPEISDDQAMDIQGKWLDKHGYGKRTPAIIPMSMDVQPIAWSPEDTQFLESKQYQAAEVCWMFGVDPRVLGLAASGQSLTYSNLESTYVDLQRMSFMPWTSRIEAALGRVLPRHVMARFDFAPMLRTTLQDRFNSYATAIEGGWMTIDEVRQLENMGPMGADQPSKRGVVDTIDTDDNAAIEPVVDAMIESGDDT